MMTTSIRITMSLAVALCVMAFAPHADAQVRIASSVIGSGATASGGGGVGLQGTVGQAVIGRTAVGNSIAHQGFWYTLPDAGISLVEERLGAATTTSIALMQNRPNPFSGKTEIRFSLPHAADISLKLYDNLGRQVMTLVDGARSAGTHAVHLNATTLESGNYVLRLASGSDVVIQMIAVVK